MPTSDPKNYFAFAGNNAGAQDCFYGLHGASAACTIAKYDPLRGDPFFQLDARLAKTIKFGENANVQLIAEAFNLTNRANYGNNFGNSIGSNKTFDHPAGFIAPSSVIIPRVNLGRTRRPLHLLTPICLGSKYGASAMRSPHSLFQRPNGNLWSTRKHQEVMTGTALARQWAHPQHGVSAGKSTVVRHTNSWFSGITLVRALHEVPPPPLCRSPFLRPCGP